MDWLEGFVLLILIICCMFAYICDDIEHNSSEYKQGYDLGYSDFNKTKALAARSIYSSNLNEFDSDCRYARGYMDGYNDRAQHEKKKLIGLGD